MVQATERANRIEAQSNVLREDQAKANMELKHALQKVSYLEESLEVSRQKHVDLLASVGPSSEKIAELNRSIRELETALKNHTENPRELHNINSEKDVADRNNGAARRLDQRLLRDKEDLNRQLASAKRESESLRADMRQLESENKRDKLSLTRQAEELGLVNRRAKNLEGELLQKENKINDLKSAAKEKAELVSQLEKRYDSLQAQSKVSRSVQSSDADSKKARSRQEKLHADEIAGLTRMLRSRTSREASFRADLSYIKLFYDKQIASFQARNKANLAIIREIGIHPDGNLGLRKRTFKGLAHSVIATIRMRNLAKARSIEKAEERDIEEAMRNRK